MTRRKLLAGIGSTTLLSSFLLPFDKNAAAQSKPGSGQPAFIAARREAGELFSVAVLDPNGTLLFSEKLENRGHATTISPDRKKAVTFARRPGHIALALDLETFSRQQFFTPPQGLHFYGHGFFSPDGALLYATENDYENERGILGIYDTRESYKRLGQFDTHGIGPHEALLMSDKKTIAVANGGILTHPDYPREKLNLSTMEPSLVYLDARDGRLLERVKLPAEYYQLSIRHMAEAGDGSIWFGGQYEGNPADSISLVGKHSRGNEIVFSAPPKTFSHMKQYIGSVAASRDGKRIATSAPRGDRIAIWNSLDGNLLEIKELVDAGGVAASPDNPADFVISDGMGRIYQGGELLYQNPDIAWDNHLTSL
ncbi:DUF1513 domain-containing protein [Kiloniella laminariae]|nr:DUF1513 domain-containing protein [Kiloniella laminariae]